MIDPLKFTLDMSPTSFSFIYLLCYVFLFYFDETFVHCFLIEGSVQTEKA
ncbi:hypothetical protein Lalb_Chr15g0084731 [Lupinus albus]|uniref:Uncharacterized protein n=1 Tax=Lupinus albus TaxID=3870 RepID=A0A6A4P9J7_LUPAL|nr:hypothetical protein Lalb_Chr15g0084731 [Lupinus albus]